MIRLLKPISVFVVLWLQLITALPVFAQQGNINVIPAPQKVARLGGEFRLRQLTIKTLGRGNSKAVGFFIDELENAFHYRGGFFFVKSPAIPPNFVINTIATKHIHAEGYRITITPQKITVTANGAGLFYAMQTLMQLVNSKPDGKLTLPCVNITDTPRFSYRGLMLDVSRHFFSVGEVKRMIDLMAYYKLNTFHWHLVDNEGWRIQIKKYPRLTSIGAYRTTTATGGNQDWPDGVPYGGFYTQNEIRKVVKYAADRYITIIPEIEMPAHSDEVQRAYPQYFCPPDKDMVPGAVNRYLYNPAEETFSFLQDVLTEVMQLFPGKYIHIGGDEAKKGPWIASAFAQQLIKDKNLKDEHGLQSYFMGRVAQFINSKGRSIIGWDEMVEGGLPPGAAVMVWRGDGSGVKAAKLAASQKHSVIMALQNAFYFDFYQSRSDQEPRVFGGYTPLDKTYNYDPLKNEFTAAEQPYVAGVQGNIWTEYMSTPAKLEYNYLPRLQALAEVGWSMPAIKNYDDFTARLPQHFLRLDRLGYNYRVPAVQGMVDTMLIGSDFTWSLSAIIPGSKIYYSLNGHEPGNTDLEYQVPLHFIIPKNQHRELRAIVITPSGKRSVSTHTVMFNSAALEAVDVDRIGKGLSYRTINSGNISIDKFDKEEAKSTGVALDLAPLKLKQGDNVSGVVYNGFIRIDEDGVYNLGLLSSFGSQLYINSNIQIDNNQPRNVPWGNNYKWVAVPMLKGLHPICIKYNFNTTTAGVVGWGVPPLKIIMNKNSGKTTELSTDRLYH